MNQLLRIFVCVVCAMVFVGCAAEEGPPEKKGSTTSRWQLPDLSEIPEGEQDVSEPSAEMQRLQERNQREQNAVNEMIEIERQREEARRAVLDALK